MEPGIRRLEGGKKNKTKTPQAIIETSITNFKLLDLSPWIVFPEHSQVQHKVLQL